MSAPLHQFTSVHFNRFKAFKDFEFKIRHFNILVGPNNAGKSTILAAFRMLGAAMRVASSRKPQIIKGPSGRVGGYVLDLSSVSAAEENIFYNYHDHDAATVRFRLSNGNALILYFPEVGSSYLIPETVDGRDVEGPSQFKKLFACPIGFVPILGPVEHKEPLYQKDAAQRALYSYQAARNFRNIWYHFPNKFDEFRSTLQQTWPGMDVEPPDVDRSHDKPLLHMFCPEERMPREIFWAGFGFQVWCQMLTHLIQASEKSIFLIDEPDIYLHSDLQRQLLGLLRNLGPDIVLATHSTEIIADAEPDDIVIVNKSKSSTKRIKQPDQLTGVFVALGSNLNPVLTQLAKTRRVVFVEGTDFQILGRFAAKCGYPRVASRSEFSVVTSDGFNPERVKNLREGMVTTLGTKVRTAVILDRDYRSDAEVSKIRSDCESFCDLIEIHDSKELENFLLVSDAIDRAAQRKLAERERRTGKRQTFTPCAQEILNEFAKDQKSYVLGQRSAQFRTFERSVVAGRDDASLTQKVFEEFESAWNDGARRLRLLPGKEAFSAINRGLQQRYSISVTPTAVIEAMTADEVPKDMRELIAKLNQFTKMSPLDA